MSDTKFTPAPWQFHIGGSGDYPTWSVHIGRGIVHLPGIEPMEVMDANARLIAAAPELYAALAAIFEWADPYTLPNCGEHEADVEAARIALAKARGEA